MMRSSRAKPFCAKPLGTSDLGQEHTYGGGKTLLKGQDLVCPKEQNPKATAISFAWQGGLG